MSEVKVNKISPRTNCGTVTLGDSGDSFVIPAGATITNNGTQTGFGASNGECSSCVQYFSGGGGAAASPGNASYGGRGLGGGSFGFNPAHTVTPACGADNQGGGGGGGNYSPTVPATGGSGIVVIRYKFQ